MEESLALQVVRAFVAKINAHQVDALYGLMTEDHLFVDVLGVARRGREVMRREWIELFTVTPDYYIACDQTLSEGETVAIFGRAGGACSDNGLLIGAHRWEAPAAWKVVVRGTRVAEWRVYMNNQPIQEIMLRIAREGAAEGALTDRAIDHLDATRPE